MKTFVAIYVKEGLSHKVWFEADSLDVARGLSAGWGVGLLGESEQPDYKPEPLPEAYNEKSARQMLGGISLATLYRWVATGKLYRVPDTRRLLVTRLSIERQTRSAGRRD